MTEPNRRRFATVLAADAYFQIRASRTASLCANLYKLANAFLIASDLSRGDFTRGNLSNANLTRIVLQDLVLYVKWKELP